MRGPINGINVFIIQELPSHPGHMRLGIVLHQEEPGAHRISISSDNRYEDTILAPYSGQDICYDTEVFMTFQGYAFPYHHWPTTPMMLQAA